jgi:hypothetical protein
MDSAIAALDATQVALVDPADEDSARPDVLALSDESSGWPMMGQVALLASDLSDSEAYDACICAGLVSP